MKLSITRFMLMMTMIALVTACTTQITSPSPTTISTAATATAAPKPAGFSVTDALGRTVTFDRAPQHAVITGKALGLVANAVYMFPEAQERIVGLGNTGQGKSNFISLIDPAYAQKAVLENNAGAEQVAALQPDLVILKSYLADSVGKPIETLGIPVVYVDLETPEQYTRDLAILGQIFQDESRATQLIDYYRSTAEQIQQATSGVKTRPRALMLYYNDKDGNVAFNVPPLNWMQTQILGMAGGDPAWTEANPAKGWMQVTLEQVATWDADQIFIISYTSDSSKVVEGLLADPNWQALRAVREGKLSAFPGDLYSWDQPDTRWILGLTWLAGRLHPDLFPNLDIIAKAQDFYQTLYGLDSAFFEKNIRPTLHGDLP